MDLDDFLNRESDSPKFIIAYNKDASLLIHGTCYSILAKDFLRLVDTLSTDTMLIAEGEKGILDSEEYDEMCEKKRLKSLKEFFRKHKEEGMGFMKIRIDNDDELISRLYEGFKQTYQFVEFTEE